MKTILDYKDAQKVIQKIGVQTSKEYYGLVKKGKLPKGLPNDPRLFYGESKDYHMKMIYNKNHVAYEEAQKFAKKMGVKNSYDWRKLCKKRLIPLNIPKSPQTTYKEWISWGDFHGNKIGPGRRGSHATYKEAKKLIRKLGIKSSWQYKKLKESHKLPSNLPHSPERTYKNKGWKGSGDFYGTNRNGDWQDKKNFKTYQEAKKWARASPINSLTEYRNAKLPKGVPRNPWGFYKDEWEGYKIYLDVKSPYISFEEAKKKVSEFEIYTRSQYDNFHKKQYKLPNSPHKSYKEWKGWIDFLPKKMLTYEEAKEFVKKSGIPTVQIYREVAVKGYLPDCLPKHPDSHFRIKGDWKGAEDFVSWVQPFKSFKEAKQQVQKLGIKTKTQYLKLIKQGKLTSLPRTPNVVYAKNSSRWVK